jgi:hypothetical protein
MRKLTPHEVESCLWSSIGWADHACFYRIPEQHRPKKGYEFLIAIELPDQYGEYGEDGWYFGVLTSEEMYISDMPFYNSKHSEERKLNDLSYTIGSYKALEFLEL